MTDDYKHPYQYAMKVEFFDNINDKRWHPGTLIEATIKTEDETIKVYGDNVRAAGKPVQFGEWQVCPKCNGQGTVSKPPYLAAEVTQWLSDGTEFTCDVCNGAKVIPRPIINT